MKGSIPSTLATLTKQGFKMENQGFFTRLAERESKRKKARSLSINSGVLKSDHMGPNHHRVKVDWDTHVDWRSYWMKAQQPICTWALKTAH